MKAFYCGDGDLVEIKLVTSPGHPEERWEGLTQLTQPDAGHPVISTLHRDAETRRVRAYQFSDGEGPTFEARGYPEIDESGVVTIRFVTPPHQASRDGHSTP